MNDSLVLPAAFNIQLEFEDKKKSKIIAYLLLFFLSWLGAHRLYLRNPCLAILQVITLQAFGLWFFIDLFLIPRRVRKLNRQIWSDLEMLSRGEIVRKPSRPYLAWFVYAVLVGFSLWVTLVYLMLGWTGVFFYNVSPIGMWV